MRSRALTLLLFTLFWNRTSSAAVEIVNVGVDASLGFEIQGNFVAIRTSEARAGNTDLNGDGDTVDFVLQVFDWSTGLVRNSGLEASGGFRMAGHYIAFTVLESRQGGADLNGDGDALDLVQHVYDAETGVATNLGLATSTFRIEGDLLAFTVIESAQGATDRNGDGDSKDGVLHLYRPSTGTLTNVGLDAAGGFVSNDTHAVFAVSESNQGGTDRNGDGDALDTVLHLVDASTGDTTNLGVATLSLQFKLDSNLVAFLVRESAQGNQNLNGDSDVNDNVLHVYDIADMSTSNVGRAASSFQLAGGVVAFAQPEAAQGAADANGDGDVFDEVLHYFEAASSTMTNLSSAVEGFELDAQHLAFGVREFRQAATDLNGDGDTADLVLHLHDIAAGTTVNLGTDATLGFKLDGETLLAFGAWEPGQGAGDLNGDGDVSDYVLHVYDIASGTVINLEVDPSGGFQSFQLDGKLLTFGVQEQAQGATDLNLDGDTADIVLHYYQAGASSIVNLGFDVSAGHQVQSDRIAFAVTESRQGLTDLNGDGDTGDVVLHVADLGPDDARSRIEALMALLRSMGVPQNTERLLLRFLASARAALEQQRPCGAMGWLQTFDFVLNAQQKKMLLAQAQELSAESQSIQLQLREENPGCKNPVHLLCKKGHFKPFKQKHDCQKFHHQNNHPNQHNQHQHH